MDRAGVALADGFPKRHFNTAYRKVGRFDKRNRMVNVIRVWTALPIALFCCFLENSAIAQRGAKSFQFESYPSGEVFLSSPVAPQINDPVHRRYRTRIRDGVEKGWGVFREGSRLKVRTLQDI